MSSPSDVLKRRGNVLCSQRLFVEAIAAYDAAAVLDPSNVILQSNKAAALLELGLFDAAAACCREALGMASATAAQRAKLHRRLAAAHLGKFDEGEALASYRASQECDFDPSIVAKIDALEKALQRTPLSSEPELGALTGDIQVSSLETKIVTAVENSLLPKTTPQSPGPPSPVVPSRPPIPPSPVAEFVSITGASETAAEVYLSIAEGDVPTAISIYFEDPTLVSPSPPDNATAPKTSSSPSPSAPSPLVSQLSTLLSGVTLSPQERSSSPSSLHDLSVKATSMYEEGDLVSANKLYKKALLGFYELNGPSHISTLMALSNLARVLKYQDEWSCMREYYAAIHAGCVAHFGPSHHETIAALCNLAIAHQHFGDIGSAESLFRGALKHLSPDDHDAICISINLSEILAAKGELREAKAMAEKAVKGFTKTLGPDHPRTHMASSNLSRYVQELSSLSSRRPPPSPSPSPSTAKDTAPPPAPSPSDSNAGASSSLRLKGNAAFEKKNFSQALELYDSALSLTPGDILTLSNRAAAQIALSCVPAALQTCFTALSFCTPETPPETTSKVYRRMGHAHERSEPPQLVEAMEAYTLAHSLHPSTEAKAAVDKLAAKGVPPPPPLNPSTVRFFEHVRAFYLCRTSIRDRWAGVSSGVLERLPSFDRVEVSPDVFDRGMRQRDLSGGVVQNIAALNEVATAASSVFKTVLEEMLGALGLPLGSLYVASLKKSDRAEEKARDDYSKRPDGPGLSWLFDMVRGSIILDDEKSIASVVSYLAASQDAPSGPEKPFTVVRLKNRFARPTPGGFRDVNTNLRVTVPGSDGRPSVTHICELQVHHRTLKEYAKSIGSHDVYDYFRKYFNGGTEAVDARLLMMDRMFEGKQTSAASLTMIVDQVVAEGNVSRMWAAADLVESMCEHRLVTKIRRAMIDRTRQGHQRGANSRESMAAFLTLGNSLADQGKFNDALALQQKAHEGFKRILGGESLEAFVSQSAIARTMFRMGRLDEAQRLFEAVIESMTRSSHIGPDNEETLGAMGDLAVVFQHQNKLEEAISLNRKALAIQSRLLGPDALPTLRTSNNLAASLAQIGKLDEAIELHEKALAGKIRVLGPDHLDSLGSMMNIAILMGKLGRFKEAAAHMKQVAAGRTQTLGPQHPKSLEAKHVLSIMLDAVKIHTRVTNDDYTRAPGGGF